MRHTAPLEVAGLWPVGVTEAKVAQVPKGRDTLVCEPWRGCLSCGYIVESKQTKSCEYSSTFMKYMCIFLSRPQHYGTMGLLDHVLCSVWWKPNIGMALVWYSNSIDTFFEKTRDHHWILPRWSFTKCIQNKHIWSLSDAPFEEVFLLHSLLFSSICSVFTGCYGKDGDAVLPTIHSLRSWGSWGAWMKTKQKPPTHTTWLS